MFALAEEVMENGAHDFSVQSVADRAGVSHRTVYRYYSTRDELINAFADWANAQIGFGEVVTQPNTFAELTEKTAVAFELFDTMPGLIEAQVSLQQAGVELDIQRRNTARFARCVEEAAKDVDPRHRQALAALVRNVVSSQSWARARREFDVDGEMLGQVTAWALGLIERELRTGGIPTAWENEDDAE